MAVPSQMKAMVVQPDRTIKLSTVPGPKIEDPEQIIVKVHSCAQNPTDAKGIEMGRTRAGLIPGVDFSGIVVEVGSDVTNVKVGDKVASISFGSFLEPGTGAFSEYCRVPGGRAIRIPKSMSFNEATTLGASGITALCGLYELLELPEPIQPESDTPILVWSGATSVGMSAIQLATLSGLQVITTASPRNHDLLKSLGAKHVLDYNSQTVVEDISRLSNGRLQYIYDTVSTHGSTQTACKALSGAGGKVVVLLPTDPSTLEKNVELLHAALFKLSGKPYSFAGRDFPANPAVKKWYEDWISGKLSELVMQGKLKGNPIKVMGGFESINDGFKYMGEGKVHAEKLVYEIIKE